jgi:hypothetical protein
MEHWTDPLKVDQNSGVNQPPQTNTNLVQGNSGSGGIGGGSGGGGSHAGPSNASAVPPALTNSNSANTSDGSHWEGNTLVLDPVQSVSLPDVSAPIVDFNQRSQATQPAQSDPNLVQVDLGSGGGGGGVMDQHSGSGIYGDSRSSGGYVVLDPFVIKANTKDTLTLDVWTTNSALGFDFGHHLYVVDPLREFEPWGRNGKLGIGSDRFLGPGSPSMDAIPVDGHSIVARFQFESYKKMKHFFEYLEKRGNDGLWLPPYNDCHSSLFIAARGAGAKWQPTNYQGRIKDSACSP